MQIDPEELRQRFADLSDEGLLSIDRADLIELAQQYYDTEVARRGLHTDAAKAAQESPVQEKLVAAATFLSFEEANLGRALLRSAEIPAYLENELTANWTGANGLRLMVPASFLEQAEEILEARISDEELLAQAEAAEPVEPLAGDEQD